jgi:hypothetical protein
MAGVAASARVTSNKGTINLVHRDEGSRHAGGGLEEAAPVQTLLAAEIVGHVEQPRLDFALPFVLRIGIEFVAGDDLGRDRCLVGTQFGRHQRGEFFFGQIAAHQFAPCFAPDFSGRTVAKTRPCSRTPARALLAALFTKSWVHPTL